MKKLQCFGTLMMLLTMLSAKVQSQPTDKDFPEQPSDKYSFDHFTTDGAEGLGGGRIRQHDGFTWFSGFTSFNEIVRFDGTNFHFAELYFGDSLNKASTFYYLFDRKGQLWYGARGNMYLCKKPNSWVKKGGQSRKYKLHIDSTYTKILDHNFVTNIIGEDKNGNLWIAQSSGKLYSFNPENGDRKIFKFPAGQQVVDWLMDKQGRVWVISNKELYVFDPIEQNFLPASILKAMGVSADTELRKMLRDTQNNLWIGTDRAGVFQFPFNIVENSSIVSRLRKPLQAFKCDIVKGIVEDKNKRIWVGTQDEGLSIYDYRAKKWEQTRRSPNIPSGLSIAWIESMYADNQGRVWIGSTVGGIDLFDPARNHFRHLAQFDAKSKTASDINYMYFGKGDSLYISDGTQDFELTYSIKERRYRKTFQKDLPHLPREIQIWIRDDDNKDWFIKADGIYTYDLSKKKLDFYRLPDGRQYKIFTVNVAAIVNKKHGDRRNAGKEIWIGDELGLIRFDIDTRKWLDNSDLPAKLMNVISNRTITLIKAGADNSVYMAGVYMPLVKYEIDSGKVHLAGYSKQVQQTNYILEEKTSIWAGTDLGLYELLKADLSVNKKHNLGNNDYPGSAVSMIMPDEKKHYWVFGTAELSEYLPGKGVLSKFYYKDEVENLPSGLTAIFKHKDGTIFFSGTKGITYFNPNELKRNAFIPPVRITDIHVMGKPYPTDSKELELTYKENFVDFGFVALNFTSAAKNQYKYKMEGIDEQWINAETKRTANYTNLPPGNYTFRVIGSNNDGVWNKDGTSVTITITPPWWGTWWFRSLLILLFAAGVYGLFRFRLAQQLRQRENEIRASLMAQEAERQRFSRELHDGIGANLSLLKMYLSSFGDADVPMAELKERSERLLAGSVDEIRRLIHDMHPRNLKEMGLVRAVEEMVSLVNLGSSLKVEFEARNVTEHLPEQVEINLFRIVQELLQNAMKHSAASGVWLNFVCLNERFYLTYRDNGIGFDTSITPTGNGLLNIKNRVMLLKGEMLSNSSIGDGARISLNFECACIV